MARRAAENNPPAEGLGWRTPDPINARFETPRLIVRPLTLDDVEPLFAVIERSRTHLFPWVTWADTGHKTLAQTAAFIAEQQRVLEKPAAFTAITLAVVLRETGGIVGGTGLHDVRPDTASAETGYWIAAGHTRNGYAAEACRHTISWAFRPQTEGGMGLRRIRLYCSAANEPSRRLIDGLGIRREVEQREDYWIEGIGPTTRLGWGILADEWDTASHGTK
ncbi:MAG: GNAT family protein [Planctomycetota bacterium]